MVSYSYNTTMFTKGIWDKLANHKLVQSISQNYNKIKYSIQNTFNITQVLDRIYHIDYPQTHHLKMLAAHIKTDQYQFWNLSQYSYEKEFTAELIRVCPRGEMRHLCYEFYTNSPFMQLLEAIDQIYTFLAKNKQAKVYLHCQESKIRSAVFLSCYIMKHRCEGITCISDAIVKVNKQLGVCLQEKSLIQGKGKYANHHLLIKNFINYQTDPKFINEYQLQLRRIVLSNPPSLMMRKDKSEVTNWQEVKVYAELRCAQQMVWKGVAQKVDDSLLWSLKVDISDEFLIVVKYMVGKEIYRMLRVQLNSNFIFQENATIQQNNIDLSPYVAAPQKVIQIKLQFGKMKELSKLALKAVERQNKKQEIKRETGSEKVKEEVNEHNFAVESQEENQEGSHMGIQNADEDLQTRIEKVMREMAERELRDQAQNEQIDEDDENEQEAFQILQMSQQNCAKTIQLKEEPKSSDNQILELNSQQQTTLQTKPQILIAHLQNQEPSSEQQQDLQDYLKRLQSQAL